MKLILELEVSDDDVKDQLELALGQNPDEGEVESHLQGWLISALKDLVQDSTEEELRGVVIFSD